MDDSSSRSSSSSSGGPQVAVAVRGDGRGSRRAAGWAAANMPPGAAGRVVLVHVIPPLAFVPTPSGEQVPVERMDRETVEMYAEDRRARAQDVFLPFRRLCGRRTLQVETVVLEGDSVAETLVRYAAESGVRSLVLGSASLSWFRRILRLRDVPATVLKTMPSSCNVFVVSRRKLTIKFPVPDRTSKLNTFGILSVNHKSFNQKQRDWFQENAKHLQAVGTVEIANDSSTREAYSNCNSETVANLLSTEKAKVVDALLSSGRSCRRYSRHEIEIATDYFSDARKIGEGGYGNVYRCTLDHTEVAVKVIQQDSRDKIDEFLREVEILSQLHHPNLVMLLGFCPEIGCLVYEYMENGSLEDHLSNNNGHQPLHWNLRFQIIFEVARGLAFLHGTKPEPIVHRDLKPGNILLDKNYVSKIGDVGFAKLISDLVPEWLTEYKETVIAGTMFYMDPEYQLTGTVRPKSDLFALGIIILQLLTGKPPLGLILSVEEAIEKGTFPDILDNSQTDWPIVEAEMLAKLGLRCTALKCRDRPNLDSELLPELENILSKVTAFLKLKGSNIVTPRHFICPILQEVIEDPYIAADGHSYEERAIRAWLRKHKISPVTKKELPNLSIIPNYSLYAAIQQWKSQIS